MDDARTDGLSGTWVGSYFDPASFREDGSHDFGIAAQIVGEGESISGTMTDLHAVTSYPFRWAMADVDEETREGRAAKAFLRRHPEAIVRLQLPERSKLVGTVVGDWVRFEKRYVGLGLTTTVEHGRELWKAVAGEHPIEYGGTLADGGRAIVGEWVVRGRSLLGRIDPVLARGTFRLVRQEGAEGAG